MNAHAFAEACPKFAESIRRDPGIGTMLGLADCYEKNGQVASAWAEFREAAAAASRKGDRREALARSNAARLEPLLTKILVRVRVTAHVRGLVVKRDGVDLGRALWDEPVPVDPGVHAISAAAPGAKEWETTVDAPRTPGVQTVTIPRLEPAPPPPSPSAAAVPPAVLPLPPPPPAGDSGRTQRIAGGVAAGAGVIGVAVGAVLGLVAKSKLDQSNADNHCDAADTCDTAGLALRSNAGSAALGSTVAFIAGGVLVAGGAALWLTAPRPTGAQVGLAPGPRGVVLVGAW
jgi:hypothetical protein